MGENKAEEYARDRVKALRLSTRMSKWDQDWHDLEMALAAAFRAGAAWGASEATKKERIVVPRESFERGVPDMKPGTITYIEKEGGIQ